ncbi:MAG: TIGR00730 family Rossman fold protein [Gammaproteobacteria bacterium]|nr:TIGR00730 family Rossman fold protein [Gammaproteobacteria bacterium]
MKSICVYLGAHEGNHPPFARAVTQLGQEIVNQNLALIYGGSSLGLMGQLADTVKSLGGRVTGIITQQLIDKEIPPAYLDQLHVVETMQERKQMMHLKSDLFLVMPGGLGTLEEGFETWNAIKMGLFNKPIGFLNVDGYFDFLFSFIKNCTQKGLITEQHAAIPNISADIKDLLKQLGE